MNKVCLLFIVVAISAGSAFAADKKSSGVTPNLAEGTNVLEGAGYFDLMRDDVQLQLSYGQFVVDGIEVALVAGLRDNDHYMSTELGVRGEYNLALGSPLVPFLSTGVVWTDVEADDSNLDTDAAVFSVGAGVKYFIRDDVALALNGSYIIATDDIFVDSDDGELQDDEFRILFSLRFHF